MILISGVLNIDPTKADVAMAAMKAVMAATQQESGCEVYTFTQDMSDPGTFHLFERWASEEALAGHMEAPHMKEFQGAMGEFGVTGADFRKYVGATETDLFG